MSTGSVLGQPAPVSIITSSAWGRSHRRWDAYPDAAPCFVGRSPADRWPPGVHIRRLGAPRPAVRGGVRSPQRDVVTHRLLLSGDRVGLRRQWLGDLRVSRLTGRVPRLSKRRTWARRYSALTGMGSTECPRSAAAC